MTRSPEEGDPDTGTVRGLGRGVVEILGPFGVAFSIFQGLEPFLEFSRLVAYLVDHWRMYTHTFWRQLAQIFQIQPPAVFLDLATVFVFLAIFTARVYMVKKIKPPIELVFIVYIFRPLIAMIAITLQYVIVFCNRTDRLNDIAEYNRYIPQLGRKLNWIERKCIGVRHFGVMIFMYTFLALFSLVTSAVVPILIFTTMHPYLSPMAEFDQDYENTWIVTVVFTVAYVLSLNNKMPNLALQSYRAMRIIGIIFAINWLSLHADAIEAFLDRAT